MLTASRTFYCPTCGNAVSLMLGRSTTCNRCGRQVTPPLSFQMTPGTVALPARSSALAPRSGGTPGIVVALLLYFFFPVGLYLLWTHPVWPDSQKWKYTIIWLSLFGGLILFSLFFSLFIAMAMGKI
jgi:hypothetical protein